MASNLSTVAWIMKSAWMHKYERDLERDGRFLRRLLNATKPRLRRRHGIWVCSVPGSRVLGHGYGPRDAFEDWRSLTLAAWGRGE